MMLLNTPLVPHPLLGLGLCLVGYSCVAGLILLITFLGRRKR